MQCNKLKQLLPRRVFIQHAEAVAEANNGADVHFSRCVLITRPVWAGRQQTQAMLTDTCTSFVGRKSTAASECMAFFFSHQDLWSTTVPTIPYHKPGLVAERYVTSPEFETLPTCYQLSTLVDGFTQLNSQKWAARFGARSTLLSANKTYQ